MAKYRKSQGWAERKVNTACKKFINTYPIKPWTHYAAQPLLAEHRRAVRVVKRLEKAVELDQQTYTNRTKGYVLAALREALAALQKGRT